jgi:hypothetical protein
MLLACPTGMFLVAGARLAAFSSCRACSCESPTRSLTCASERDSVAERVSGLSNWRRPVDYHGVRVLQGGARPRQPGGRRRLGTGEIREGALIVADNANWSPEYLAKVRAPTQGYMSVPFAEDVELSIKVH